VQKYNPGSQKKGEVKGNDKKKGFNNRKIRSWDKIWIGFSAYLESWGLEVRG
jgi:hypothetical protein